MKTNMQENGMTQGHQDAVIRLGGIAIATRLKAGSLTSNHNQKLPVKSGAKAGGLTTNHNQVMPVKTNLKAGFPPGPTAPAI